MKVSGMNRPACAINVESNCVNCNYLIGLLTDRGKLSSAIEEFLRHNCCDLNRPNSFGITPLRAAIKVGNVATVQLMLTSGAHFSNDDVIFARQQPHADDEVASIIEKCLLMVHLRQSLTKMTG
jgi:hypothetical protein